MKKIIGYVSPPGKWKVPVIIISGTLIALVLLVLHIGNATSYLSDDPRACINCHVMTTQYISWAKSSHARVATCNDCHVPHDNIIRTYYFKAMDGTRHTTIFTLRIEPQVIKIKDAGINVVQQNCVRCHAYQVMDMPLAVNQVNVTTHEPNGVFCWDCHQNVPHGSVRSLSAYPNANVPPLEPVLPEFIRPTVRQEEPEF
jgi:cytochrome c nitrite reductase small subunit